MAIKSRAQFSFMLSRLPALQIFLSETPYLLFFHAHLWVLRPTDSTVSSASTPTKQMPRSCHVDNEEKVHDLSKEVWEYDGDVDVASPEVEAAPVAEQPVGGDGVGCETADGESSQAAQPAPAWLRQLDMKFADGSPSFFSPAEGSRRQKRGYPAL